MSSFGVASFRERFRKPTNASASLERRRERALLSQRDSRAKTVAKARAVALKQLLEDADDRSKDDGDRMDDESSSLHPDTSKRVSFNTQATEKKTVKSRRQLREESYAEQFLIPEWMVDVPNDLDGSRAMMKSSSEEQGWFVMARPEGAYNFGWIFIKRFMTKRNLGQRCLVIAAKGYTESRKKNGKVLHRRFASVLPNGSRATRGRVSEYCVLECVFQEQNQTYFVIDLGEQDI